MKKAIANIIKDLVGTLPLRQSSTNSISWYNQKILKHQEDSKEKVFSFLGLSINYKRPYELIHTFEDIFSREIYRFKANTQTPLIIDCGANIGLAVIYFKSQFPNARIIAFEPDITNFKLLEKNVTANNLTKVSVQQTAVWTTNGSIAFASEASEASHITTDGSSKQLVNAIRLADLLLAEGKVDFLKIDIEGAEWPVIKDCKAALKNVQNLFLEYHGRTDETYKLADLYAILSQTGFSVYVQNAADSLRQPFIKKTSNGLYDVQLNIYCFRQ